MGFLTLPNLISLGRLISVPFVVGCLLKDLYIPAFWIFVIASISDGIDGYLARVLNIRTIIGTYLDPLADKIMLAAVFIVLSMQGHIALWLMWLVILRDIFIFIGVVTLKLFKKPLQVTPSFVSKLNTVLQMVLVLSVMAHLAFRLNVINSLITWIGYFVAATTMISWYGYFMFWLQKIKEKRPSS
jgi:cardiolipin synthase